MKFDVKSNCKINLGLNVVGVLESGYHLLDMVMIPISLSDRIVGEIYDESGDLIINTNKEGIPTDKSNILYKIYDKFYEKSGFERKKIEVYLEKIVPFEAGLGGGSSNGAFFLKELNRYYDNFFNEEMLIEIGKSVGADIPFFIKNKPCRVEGIGEKLTEIENNLVEDIIVIKPSFGVSTAKAYGNMKKLEKTKSADIDGVIKGLKENDLSLVQKSIENNLEEGLLVSEENIISFRKLLEEFKELKFFMSGSGSAYYTFVSKDTSNEVFEKLKRRLQQCEVFLCSGI